ncbi:MAG: hypothetical protein QN178_01055 [Armatimonadota bacterium]|nr:hypothetical protein [Armatimonadota bacterium]
MTVGIPPAVLEPPPRADRETRIWWTLAAAALVMRFLMMPYGGFPTDIGTMKAWATGLAERGPAEFYGSGFADYLPGYLYVLWAIGEVNRAVRFSDQALLFALKLPSAIADIGTSWLIFAMGRRAGSALALRLAASYLFNPGIIFNSAFWGQADAVGAFFALAGVSVLDVAAPPLVAVLITTAALVKPQTAPVAIPVGLALVRRLWKPAHAAPRWDLLLASVAAGVAVLVLAGLPFRLSLIGLARVLRTAVDVYPHGSVVAFNLWGALQGFWGKDSATWLGVPLYVYGAAATGLALVAVAVWAWRRDTLGEVAFAAAVVLLITFILPTRIHERYLLPAIPFFAVAAMTERRLTWLYGGLSALLALNLLYAYTRPYVQTFALPTWLETTVFSDPGTRALSALGVLALGVAFLLLLAHRGDPSAGPDR